MCLVYKMLLILPDREIIQEYLKQPDYKYLRALAAFYLRLTEPHKKVYLGLEPYLKDFRKLRFRDPDGRYKIIHMDEYIDWLLTMESVFEINLPFLPKRYNLEEQGKLQERPEYAVEKPKEENKSVGRLTFKGQPKVEDTKP